MAGSEQTVVVLGCGIGGVVAANTLRRQLPPTHRVVVIDREARASFPPSYLWVMTGARKPGAIARPRARLARKGIEFVQADVRQIDLESKHVRAESREFRYDYLVIALGADMAFDSVPGLAEVGQTYYTFDGAERLAASLRYFAGGRVLIAVAGTPYKCPAAPYEGAMLLETYFHERRARQKVDIQLCTPEPAPLPVAGPAIGQEVLGLLKHKGIDFQAGRRLTGVDAGKHEVVYQDGTSAPFDMLIVVPEHRSPAPIREAGLTDETGWVPVDAATLETRYEGVFAVGDVNYIRLPDGMMLPKAGVFAEAEAKAAARTIASRVMAGTKASRFTGAGRCFLEIGAGAAGMVDGDFFSKDRRLSMKQPSILWHWTKVAFEKYWLWRWY